MPLTITPLIAPDQPWMNVESRTNVAHAKIYDVPSKVGFLGGRMTKIIIWRAGEESKFSNALFYYNCEFDKSNLDGRGFLFLYQLVDQIDGWAWLRFIGAVIGFIWGRFVHPA